MSTTATKFTKTLVSGTKGTLVLEPGVLFSRKTNLPINWNHVRIGIIASLTDTVGLNNVPVEENLPISNNLSRLFFGLSNGNGILGQSENQSLGMLTTDEIKVKYYSNNWYIESDGYSYHELLSGVSINNGTSVNVSGVSVSICPSGIPNNTSSCFFSLCLDLSLSNDSLSIQNCSNNSALSEANDSVLMSILAGGTYQTLSTETGGWWNSVNPVNCTYFNIRSPFINNRLRLHNIMVLDMSL